MSKEKDDTVSIFSQWCQVSTCGGVIDWFNAKHKFGKRFWLSVIVICLVLTIFMISLVVIEYCTSAKYTTSILMNSANTGVQFPNITICNLNRASSSKISEIGISPEALTYAFGSFMVFYDVPLNTDNLTILANYENSWREFVETNSSNKELGSLFNKIGSDCKTTFWSCLWKAISINCCSHVTEVVNSYGKCFIFSVPANDSLQLTPGVSQGLKIILDPHLEEYSTNVVENNFLEEGFVLYPSYVYEPLLPDPIAIGSGIHAWISLSQRVEMVTPPKYQMAPLPCRSDVELKILSRKNLRQTIPVVNERSLISDRYSRAMLIIVSDPYSKQNCFLDCMLVQMINHCGCIFLLDSANKYPVCNASVARRCMASAVQQSSSALIECTGSCLSPCGGLKTVSATITSSKFQYRQSDDELYQIFASMGFQTDFEKVRPVSLDIYFPRMEIFIIETTENTSVFTFLSNIGGQLGLWLGISVVTCIQLLYYIFMCTCQHFKSR